MATHTKKHIKHVYDRELIICNGQKDEYYAYVIEAKGNARFEVKILKSSLVIIAKASGRIIKGPNKQKIMKNDYVLLQKDLSSSEDKYYIIHKYTQDDIKKLKKSNELIILNNSLNDDNESTLERTVTNILFEGDDKEIIQTVEIDDDYISNI